MTLMFYFELKITGCKPNFDLKSFHDTKDPVCD